MIGKEINWQGRTYRIVMVDRSVPGGNGVLGLPVTAIRTECGRLVSGLANLSRFVLDADEAAGGAVKVLAKG